MSIFTPDYFKKELSQITPCFLKEAGVTALVMDIDNTIVTYDDPVPTPAAEKWFDEMEKAGIKIAFVSNNSKPDRVNRFNENLGYFATYKSGKPFPRNVWRAIDAMGVKRENAMIIGDQLFTDVMAGKFAGIKSTMVWPIRDLTNLFFRFKRLLEKMILCKVADDNNMYYHGKEK